jgi:hypothetical protein
MAEDVYEDAVADVVGPDAMISAPYVVKVGVFEDFHVPLHSSLNLT